MKRIKNACKLENRTLSFGGEAVLSNVSANITLDEDPTGAGVFLAHPANPERGGWATTFLGEIAGMRRFTALKQRDPFWLVPLSGDKLPEERHICPFILAECEDGAYTVLVPVPSADLEHSVMIFGGSMYLVAENGDLELPIPAGAGLFVAHGRNLQSLLDKAAHAVYRRHPSARLRGNKNSPKFQDTLGWCTWNAFYHTVSAEKVEEGLRAFRAAGVQPRFLILDDGWQDVAGAPLSSRYLKSVKANGKFPGGLAPLVKKAKKEYGLGRFFVWHTAYGVPCGFHPDSKEMAKYNARRTTPPPGLVSVPENFLNWTDATVFNVPTKSGLARYYKDQHDYLRAEGVDGVKIDYQGVASLTGAIQGGAQNAIDSMRDVVEASCREHFGDEWISCMSCLPSILYHARHGNVVRGSDDFYPNQPAKHGLHIRSNALTALWFGRFTGIDWDMFQSADEFGLYHAAARAVSGGPVYVADAPDAIRADVLRKVACPDGTVPRYPEPAMPTARSIFWKESTDKRRAPTAFAVSNGCFIPRQGGAVAAGSIAVFDMETGEAPFPGGGAQASVEAHDVPGMYASRCAVWKHNARELSFVKCRETMKVRTGESRFEVLTVAPMLRDTYAILGIVSMFAAPLTVKEIEEIPGALKVKLACGGEFAAALIDPPSAVSLGGKNLPFDYDEENCLLLVDLPDDRGALELTIKF